MSLLLLLAAATSAWDVQESTQALTRSTTVSAVLEADAPVLNMIGQYEKPALILRCQEGTLAAYIAWPQVLDTSVLSSGDSTLMWWRVDDSKIKTDFWSVSDSGTGTGMFSTGKAEKLMDRLLGAHELAVRFSGTSTQDASFTLGEFDTVAARVAAACGVKLTPAH